VLGVRRPQTTPDFRGLKLSLRAVAWGCGLPHLGLDPCRAPFGHGNPKAGVGRRARFSLRVSCIYLRSSLRWPRRAATQRFRCQRPAWATLVVFEDGHPGRRCPRRAQLWRDLKISCFWSR